MCSGRMLKEEEEEWMFLKQKKYKKIDNKECTTQSGAKVYHILVLVYNVFRMSCTIVYMSCTIVYM